MFLLPTPINFCHPTPKYFAILPGAAPSTVTVFLWFMSGYHADTLITIKAEDIHEADSHIH